MSVCRLANTLSNKTTASYTLHCINDHHYTWRSAAGRLTKSTWTISLSPPPPPSFFLLLWVIEQVDAEGGKIVEKNCLLWSFFCFWSLFCFLNKYMFNKSTWMHWNIKQTLQRPTGLSTRKAVSCNIDFWTFDLKILLDEVKNNRTMCFKDKAC